jgi:hypothetical protein
MPTISGMYLSERFDMSLSVPSLFAQKRIMAIGRTDAKTRDMTSRTMNLDKSNPPGVNDNVAHIIKKSGMQIIGGLVSVEIVLAIFSLFIFILYDFIIYNHESQC